MSMLRDSDAQVALPGEYPSPYCDDRLISLLPVDLGVRSEKVGLITRRNHESSPAMLQVLEVFRAVGTEMFLMRAFGCQLTKLDSLGDIYVEAPADQAVHWICCRTRAKSTVGVGAGCWVLAGLNSQFER